MVGLRAIPIILVQVMAMLYLEHRWLKHHDAALWLRLLWWFPALAVILLVIKLGMEPDFIPANIRYIDVYVLLMGMVAAPLTLLALSSFCGRVYRHVWHTRRNWGNIIGLVAGAGFWVMTVYGTQIEPAELEVRRVELAFDDLPRQFDGYRIVQFTDAHVGTFVGHRRAWLQNVVDSINAQHADLVAFTGDLQNIRPSDITPVAPLLASIRGKDGVVSVLGNHDYAAYTADSPEKKAASCRQTVAIQRQMGWHLLLNEHEVLRRGNDSLVIAGEQNLEKPDSADFRRTMYGVGPRAFVILLQHNPRAWDRYILPSGRVQLTLSGHTHGGQISFMGANAAKLSYKEPYGVYEEGNRRLVVSGGIGGLVAFRLGIKPEIVVITLRRR
jgi:predicted MPP superfamily phosphohydrolase